MTLSRTTQLKSLRLGPYPANLNDAEILRIFLQDPNGLCRLLAENDFVVHGRGFRDMKYELELKKINVLITALKGKRKQLTTRKSNDFHYVTKIRWALEAVYGIFEQKYRLLDHKFDSKLCPNIGTFFRIASFQNNKIEKRLLSDTRFLSDNIGRMNARIDVENTLAVEAEEKGSFQTKLVFQMITSEDILDFPEMTKRDLKILFTGTYQYVKQQCNVLKLQAQSRHISKKCTGVS